MLRLSITKTKGHIRALDGLRGTAILLVLVYHIFPYLFITNIGWIGVDLFFVLSGFLITGILFDTLHHPKYWRNFFVRRVLRIFPLYYAFIIAIIIISNFSIEFAQNEAVNFNSFGELKWWLFLYAINWKISIDSSWLSMPIFNIFWSLAVEEQFYLIWPLVVYMFRRNIISMITISISVILVAKVILLLLNLTNSYALYTLTIFRVETILWGSLIAVMIRSQKGKEFLEKYATYIVLMCFIFIAGYLLWKSNFHPFNKYIQFFGYTCVAMFFSGLLVTTLRLKPTIFTKIIESKIMVFLGKYSYGLYVYHAAIYLILFELMKDMLLSFLPIEIVADLGSSFIILGLTIAISIFSWNFFESKFIGLKKYFAY